MPYGISLQTTTFWRQCSHCTSNTQRCQSSWCPKEINLRIKASISGLIAEDYENDRALDDFSLLFTGVSALPEDFWEKHHQDLRSWNDKGGTYYEITLQKEEEWYSNQYLYLPGEEDIELRVCQVLDNRKVTLTLVDDYRNDQHTVWGITARNREQNCIQRTDGS